MNRSTVAVPSPGATERNPHFKAVDRGPYVLGHLLRELPPAHSPLNHDMRLRAEAAAQHAENGIRILTHGFKAIGTLLSLAGVSREEIEPSDAMSLGDLISHMAVELQFLQELDESIRQEVSAIPVSEKGGAK